jgi:hypothetical protein
VNFRNRSGYHAKQHVLRRTLTEKPEQAAEWQKQLDQAQATRKDTEAKPSKEPTGK